MTVTESQKRPAGEADFEHEIRVGAIIRAESGYTFEHGGTYKDPVTDKPRQFDYRCWREDGWMRFVLGIECKNINPDYRFVIRGRKRERSECFHDVIFSLGAGVPYGPKEAPNAIGLLPKGLGPAVGVKRVHPSDLYPEGAFVGKSAFTDQTKGKTQTDSDVYDRWAQAIASCEELVDRSCFIAADLQKTASVVLPVVVLPNDSLWRVTYDDQGSASPREKVDQCEFFIGRRIRPRATEFTFSHVHFVTIGALQQFLLGRQKAFEGVSLDMI